MNLALSIGPLAFAPDGKTLASWGADERLRLWSVAAGKEIRTIPQPLTTQIAFSADGRRLAAMGGWYETVTVWDIATGKPVGGWHSDHMTNMAPAADLVAVGDRTTSTLRLFDVRTGKLRHALPRYQEHINFRYETPNGTQNWQTEFPALFAPDGNLVLVGGNANEGNQEGAVYPWDIRTGKRIGTRLHGNEFMLTNLAFAPDGRLLALMRTDRQICLFDPRRGTVVRNLGRPETSTSTQSHLMHDHGLMSAPPAFTPDGRTVVTTVKGVVQVCEVATGGRLARWPGHRGLVHQLVVSGDGRTLATVARDGTILAWDLARLTPSAADVPATVWDDLACPSAICGRRALEALVAHPERGIALLRGRLAPARPIDAERLAGWIVGLDSDVFEQRRAAMQALESAGPLAGPALRTALAANPPLEVRRRVEALLEALDPKTLPPATLRTIRAVQALEVIGTPAARQLLAEQAAGAPGARLTEEAAAACARLREGATHQ